LLVLSYTNIRLIVIDASTVEEKGKASFNLSIWNQQKAVELNHFRMVRSFEQLITPYISHKNEFP